MESGDVLNYAMVISLTAGKAWKPVLAGIAAWSGYKVFKRAKNKKEQVSEKILYSAANAKAVFNNAASSVGPPIASVASVAKSAAKRGLDGGVNVASAIAPVVQQAAVAAVAGAAKAAPVIGEVAGRAAIRAKNVADLAITKVPDASAAAGKFVGRVKSNFLDSYRSASNKSVTSDSVKPESDTEQK